MEIKFLGYINDSIYGKVARYIDSNNCFILAKEVIENDTLVFVELTTEEYVDFISRNSFFDTGDNDVNRS